MLEVRRDNEARPELLSMFSELYSKATELASQRKPFAIATVGRVESFSLAKRGSKAIIDAYGVLYDWPFCELDCRTA
jgi:uncharacterized protein (UPF0218 family)